MIVGNVINHSRSPLANGVANVHSIAKKTSHAIHKVIDRIMSATLLETQACQQKILESGKFPQIAVLFGKATHAIQRHPKITLAAVGITVGLGTALLVTGVVAAMIAAAALLALAVALVTWRLIAICRNIEEERTFRTIDNLELAGLLNAQEAHNLKKTLYQPAVYQKTLEKQLQSWKNNQHFSEEECKQLIQLLNKNEIHKTFQRIQKLAFEDSGEAKTGRNLKSGKNEIQNCLDQLEKSSHVQQLSQALKADDKAAFREALIAHFTELGKLQKKNENLVAFYSYRDLAEKISDSSEDAIYATFVRVARHKALFENHDKLLSAMAKRLNAIYQLGSGQADGNELLQIKEKLVEFHKVSHQLLSDYGPISTEVDDLFACYRGNFAQKYRIIDELLQSLCSQAGQSSPTFGELPLVPGLEPEQKAAIADKPPTRPPALKETLKKKLDKIRKKLEHKTGMNEHDVAKLEVQVKSLERTLADLKTIENMKSDSGVDASPLNKKSILIATCSFGTGHKQTAQALKGHLGNGAHVTILDPTEYGSDFVKETDWLYKIGKKFGKQWSCVKVFNWILAEQKYWMVNIENKIDSILCRVFEKQKNGVPKPARGKDTGMKQLLRKRFLMERPDLLVTTYHMDLNPFIEVAEEMGIPLMHVPTDLDLKLGEVFGKNSPAYPHFKTFLPDNNKTTLETANLLDAEKIHSEIVDGKEPQVAGIALRPEFYIKRSAEEIAAIKKERGIDPEATVVLVLSGGNGQELPYPEMLMSSESNGKKYHMIVVAGSNNAAGNNLNKKRKEKDRFIKGKNPHVTVEVAEDPAIGTEKTPYFIGASELSRLHAIADVAITKPGGLSIGELLQTGVPMIMDRRITPMNWEDFNINVIREQRRGLPFTGKNDLVELIEEVAAFGKKPKPNYSKWFTAQMMEMIAKVEDATDPVFAQHRKYKATFKE